MKTIIAGTDFSPSSKNACKYAALLAQKLNCKLVLFNVYEAPLLHSNVGLYGFTYSTVKVFNKTRMKTFIETLQNQFKKVEISEYVTMNDFKSELENFVSTHKVEAAVMGLETKNNVSKFLFGSEGVNIAGKIDAPVIIVPQSYKVHKISKTILAVDSNEKIYHSSLSQFENFVTKGNLSTSLIHFRTNDEIFNPVITSLKINGKLMPIKTINCATIEGGLKKYCNDGKVDLISIISKKHSIFYNFFIETNTKKISYATKIPVMATHE